MDIWAICKVMGEPRKETHRGDFTVTKHLLATIGTTAIEERMKSDLEQLFWYELFQQLSTSEHVTETWHQLVLYGDFVVIVNPLDSAKMYEALKTYFEGIAQFFIDRHIAYHAAVPAGTGLLIRKGSIRLWPVHIEKYEKWMLGNPVIAKTEEGNKVTIFPNDGDLPDRISKKLADLSDGEQLWVGSYGVEIEPNAAKCFAIPQTMVESE